MSVTESVLSERARKKRTDFVQVSTNVIKTVVLITLQVKIKLRRTVQGIEKSDVMCQVAIFHG